MRRSRMFIWLVTAISIPQLLCSEEKPLPCSAPEISQFDFWVGEWSYGGEYVGGEKIGGKSFVTRPYGNCFILERLEGAGGGFMGMSFNVYDAAEKIWKQTWVDNKGSYTHLTGGKVDNEMYLGHVRKLPNGDRHERGVWSAITADSFIWDWQISSDSGKTWRDVVHLEYARVK